ncbi:taste receptor type 2 member 42-like [Tupaia chinensis]|uniref:taste receptor type 2 member 42-like n=1 Tax=Tupaia chinensis TaxID=246437 RepID=UPI0003C8F380|nr:taste receptor type 2 member 42-like [Tupaia chinensis]XP_014438145.1 taste receptor type 2 member 42-like [Tupaia chinensis]
MLTGWDKFFLVLAIAEFIIGMLGNVFIGVVNCSQWVKNQKVSLADFILICLSVLRIFELLVLLCDTFLVGMDPYLFVMYKVAKPVALLWRISNHLATWFATCLSIVYFLKVARFSYPLFLWLKWRMNTMVFVLLLLSLFLLIFDILTLDRIFDVWINIYRTDKSNLTFYLDETITLYMKDMAFLGISCFVPIALSLTSLLLLFLSLVRHTRNLKLHSTGHGDFSTEAHKRAMKMVMSFFFLLVVHYFSLEVGLWAYSIFWAKKYTKFVILTFSVFPMGHSFILILGNHNLRQTALVVLGRLKGHLKRFSSLVL